MAGSIPQEFIRQIVETSDIVALVGGYLKLQKKGKDHWGLCPFCEDGKNPSFSVSSQKQFYYCFKCRKTGNVISFLMDHQGLDFLDSVKTLASKAGLEVPQNQISKKRQNLEPFFKVLHEASEFFESVLAVDTTAKNVRKYIVEDRKISEKSCKHFSVGYAPKSGDALTSFLSKKGFNLDIQIKAGLVKRDKENKPYDFFRDRLMFPIRDRHGKTLGFGGRSMNPKFQPKYLNTGETLVFKKGQELYGFYEILKRKKKFSKVYVVEGYMDVIAMTHNGINNCVGTLGIATSRFSIQKLLQLVNEIIFCFDGDDAGRGAAWSALENVLPVFNDGNEVNFLFLPQGEDPASILEKENKTDFELRLKKALPLSEYFIEKIFTDVGKGSLEKSAASATKAIDLLRSMPESSMKKLLEKEVSKASGLRRKHVEERAQTQAVRKIRDKYVDSVSHNKKDHKSSFTANGVTSKALAVLASYPNLIKEIKSTDWIKELSGPENKLFFEVVEYLQTSPDNRVAHLLSSLEKDSADILGSLLSTNLLLEEKNSIAYFQDCLEALKKSNPKRRIAELKLILSKEKLSSDETFELKQHLLTNLENLSNEDKELLKELSQN